MPTNLVESARSLIYRITRNRAGKTCAAEAFLNQARII
jgi:hypothetical protein